MDKQTRLLLLQSLQETYSSFEVFLNDCMVNVFKFGKASRIQLDIARYMQNGGKYIMIMAQRGQAKSTVAACYCLWKLIHNPRHRVLIISARADLAKDIAKAISLILNSMDVLECMRPEGKGQADSTYKFDVHHDLKGIDKTASVTCIGAESSIQGNRADLVLCDDIESSKNSNTAARKETLLNTIKDLSSICSNGQIILLGTPQSSDSIYNVLPGHGCAIRIWSGRYPTEKQLANYGDKLAPLIKRDIMNDPSLQTGGGLTGNLGKPTDPQMFDEDLLQEKEHRQGTAMFSLQYMLDTSLSDRNKYPLKIKDAIFMSIPEDQVPTTIIYGRSLGNQIQAPTGSSLYGEDLYRPYELAEGTRVPFTGCHMRIDPAGGGRNADETGYAVSKFCNGFIYIPACSGIPGGYTEDALMPLVEIAMKYKPNVISIEKNMGYGTFTELFKNLLFKYYHCEVIDDWQSVQKEKRIIDTLEPLLSRHRLIFEEELLETDVYSTQEYNPDEQKIYQLFHQLKHITHDRNSLLHDDRLDALEGTCAYWMNLLAIDENKRADKLKEIQLKKFRENPLGKPDYVLEQNKRIWGKQKPATNIARNWLPK